MNTYIDIYCERLEPGLWAEPINALTNLAFFIAGFFALRLLHQQPVSTGEGDDCGCNKAGRWRAYLLIALIFAMGIGSTLFHTVASLWAMLADVLPILAYQIVFIIVYAQRVIKMKCRYSYLLLCAFFVAMYISMQLPREWLNGTLEYAPALIFVTGLGLWHLKHAVREKWGLLAAAGIFLASMSMRSIDMQLCDALPFGTHFLWHCLNGLVLYLSTRAYILNARD